MIYLIGGPPKCGKTTLAKYISKEKEISWVSTDTLQNIVKPYVNKDKLATLFPSSVQRCESNDEKYSKFSTIEIIDAYRKQSRTVWDAIDMFVISEITDGNDFVIEGYHIEPELVIQLERKYEGKIKNIFLIKKDEEKFLQNIKKSTTPNDWIIENTQNKETYKKIANMISKYSSILEEEAEKYEVDVINMDDDFNDKMKTVLKD